MKNRALIAIKNYNDFIARKENIHLIYGDMINAIYQRFRSNFIIPKSLKIEYCKFRFKDDGSFSGVSFVDNYKVKKEILSSLEEEINSALESLEYFDTYASSTDKRIFQLESIINSIKYYTICL